MAEFRFWSLVVIAIVCLFFVIRKRIMSKAGAAIYSIYVAGIVTLAYFIFLT
jgi:hypothetical protein